MVTHKLTEYNEIKEDPKEFSQIPVKVDILPSSDSDSVEKTSVDEVISTNLNEIENIIRKDMSSEIITINDEEDLQSMDCNDEIKKLNQAINQDLHDTLETDEASMNLINIIRFEDKVHEGKDEATLNLVTKLEAEAKAKENKFN